MSRNQIDERKVIDAVKGAIEVDRGKEPILLPERPEYPDQVWIELPKYNCLSYEDVLNLQKALHRRNVYGISIHPCAMAKTEYDPVLRICAYAPEMRPSLFIKDM